MPQTMTNSSPEIKVWKLNNTYLIIECEDGIKYELRDYFSFKVPGHWFMPAFKSGKWDGYLRLFNVFHSKLYVGLLSKLVKFAKDNNYSIAIDENLKTNHPVSKTEILEFIRSLKTPYEPRDNQTNALTLMARNERHTILSPTGSGKSYISYCYINWLKEKRGLIVVPEIGLVEQLISDFDEYGNTEPIHKIYSGKEKNTDLRITVTTWQSVYKLPQKFFEKFEFVIGDEVHLFKADSLKSIMEKSVNARYRMGMTGTLDDSLTNRLVIEGLFGPIKRVETTHGMMKKGELAQLKIKMIVLKHEEEFRKDVCKASYQEELEYLFARERRNNYIKNLVLSLKGNTLVLYNYVKKHGEPLYKLISESTDNENVFFIAGSGKKKITPEEKEHIRRLTETLNNAIIIASYGKFSTGVNIKNIDNIVFASPYKSKIKVSQSIGRGLRTSERKDTCYLYDISDDLRYKRAINTTYNHFEKRIELYNKELFKYKIYEVDF